MLLLHYNYLFRIPVYSVNIRYSGVVPLLMKAIGWQGGSILALETLKRVVAAGNRARDALVAQGLKYVLVCFMLVNYSKIVNSINHNFYYCAAVEFRNSFVFHGFRIHLVGLVMYFLGFLTGGLGGEMDCCSQMKWNESEASIGRVLAIEVLHAFATEGAHCNKVREILNASDVWSAYKDQKHDLFLPSSAQSAAAGVAGLIEILHQD
ncbi:hypothetical protein POTOM_062225 [Populus tomentosa]|uniref:Uncharacterized protein n=1 Tax=Populus tomentosa TaxID=118781 RepID=A0A8X7XX30_POPTO|nr:hypothetical protein POTOM_062225 [Populus tomentosa]